MEHVPDVEELTLQLNSGTSIQSECHPVVDGNARHPRIDLYKNHNRAIDQERRWRTKLRELERKEQRETLFDQNRGLPKPVQVEIEGQEQKKRSNPWASKPVNYCGKSWRHYSTSLMLAEWFLFKPPLFHSDYLMKLCPKGRHVFVRASKGVTTIYSRTGSTLSKTRSRLPGGGLGQSDRQNKTYVSVLDCIMLRVKENKKEDGVVVVEEEEEKEEPMEGLPNCVTEFRVLDICSFRDTTYTNIPVRERCSWLEEYLREKIEEFVEGDPVRFQVLPSHSCELESMQTVLYEEPKYEIDGILFYHSSAIYEAGPTPLVGWLKPYMLPDWFPELDGLHPTFLTDMPADYTDYAGEIRVQEERAKHHIQQLKASQVDVT